VEDQAPEVAREIAALYGDEPLIEAGVVHVCAAARAADGALRVLKIGERSPKSATDFFVLNLCRARADAILTTAANLRAEPTLRHVLQGAWASLLAAYRRDELGKAGEPTCAILTRTGELPLEHPVWGDGTRKLVLCPDVAEAEVAARVGERAEVIGLSGLDAPRACAFLEERGHGLISVEAGPSTSRELYGAAAKVDELLLSLFEGGIADAELGGGLPERAMTAGRVLAGERVRREESGSWRFQRWVRRG
jgi:riboflavin biosynthesis pyrimidine reductase